ncbi:hypothetical protein ASF62_05010 [Leifsonia sp. Leaf325]|nr:hypothetical protein [Leifsonia sp. Leaf325]KQQ95842.1 hypothetical protein ASF62_05010 [Leifsonia sp. Leaf325]
MSVTPDPSPDAAPGGGRLRRALLSGATPILAATVVAGASGYLVTTLVGATRPPAEYAGFAVFWSTLYLVIAALSGLQQEITRGTHPRPADAGRGPRFPLAARFAASVAAITAIVVLAATPFLTALIPGEGVTPALAIALGTASYVVVAVLAGTLYGLSLWPAIGLMISIDGVLRLVGVVIVILAGGGISELMWAVVLPFPITPLVLWWFLRRRVRGRSQLDVGPRRLTWNIARTLAASVSTGILISGYPLLLSATSVGVPAARLGALVFGISLVRAPLVIVVLSLQSFLVVRFRDDAAHAYRLFVRLALLIAVVAAVLAVIAAFVVPAVLDALWPAYHLDGWTVAGLVATSGVLGILCVSGPLTLARGRHGAYTAGWVVAAVTTIGLLLVPLAIEERMVLSLAVGPVIGVIVHTIASRHPAPIDPRDEVLDGRAVTDAAAQSTGEAGGAGGEA